jgi:hypothetical protein
LPITAGRRKVAAQLGAVFQGKDGGGVGDGREEGPDDRGSGDVASLEDLYLKHLPEGTPDVPFSIDL